MNGDTAQEAKGFLDELFRLLDEDCALGGDASNDSSPVQRLFGLKKCHQVSVASMNVDIETELICLSGIAPAADGLKSPKQTRIGATTYPFRVRKRPPYQSSYKGQWLQRSWTYTNAMVAAAKVLPYSSLCLWKRPNILYSTHLEQDGISTDARPRSAHQSSFLERQLTCSAKVNLTRPPDTSCLA